MVPVCRFVKSGYSGIAEAGWLTFAVATRKACLHLRFIVAGFLRGKYGGLFLFAGDFFWLPELLIVFHIILPFFVPH